MGPRRTIVEMFRAQVEQSAQRIALRSRRGDRWVGTTWAEWDRRSREIAGGLVAAGIEPGDRVAIFAPTREEWVLADVAIALAGAVTVPIYPTLPSHQAAHVLEDSGAKLAFVGDADQLERVATARADGRAAALERIVAFEGGARVDAMRPKVVTLGEFADRSRADEVEARASRVGPDDLATVVYTSGTTGLPKGAMLTHGNFAFEAQAVRDVLSLSTADEQLLFLPLAHIFAKVVYVAQLEAGFTTAFAQSLHTAIDDMLEVQPTVFASVPRVFEKVRAVVLERASEDGAVREKAFAWALDVGARMSRRKRQGEEPGALLAVEHRGADRLVLSKVRERFGRRLRFAISGGAPLAKDLAEWFHACGVLVLEGYGLTETTAATHVNRPERFRFGSVGMPLPGVEARIADDGEVLVRGDNVMRGYLGHPDATAESIDADGWFHTGDVGAIDAEGFLTITDRKKDIIATAGGKKVAPQSIEAALKRSPYVSQAMVHGDGRKYLVALLTLDAEAIGRWARERDKSGDMAKLATDPDVRALLDAEVAAVNRTLAQFETIKRFAVLGRDLSVDRGELTPTLKVKRKVVYERYREIIDALYDEDR